MAENIVLIILFAPIFVVLILANLADGKRGLGESGQGWAISAYLVLSSLWVAMIFIGILVSASGLLLGRQPLTPDITASFVQAGLNDQAAAELIQSLPELGTALWLPSIGGLILLLPPLRRLLARVLPLDGHSTVHAVALSFTMLVVVNLWVTVAFGLANLADMMESGETLEAGALINATWVQELLFFLIALIGVGWLIRRQSAVTLVRLGIVRPTLSQIGIGIGTGVVLVAVLIPLEYVLVSTGLGIDEDVARLGEQIIGPMMTSIVGILTLGLAAALGEEAIFRGALQPRFGLVLTSLLFALLHSTYGITLSTAVVFVLGLILGWIRNRHNTTTSMIVHAVYNMGIGFMSYWGLWPEW
jgi:membrane protease YdiL (CAAX protease family)